MGTSTPGHRKGTLVIPMNQYSGSEAETLAELKNYQYPLVFNNFCFELVERPIRCFILI